MKFLRFVLIILYIPFLGNCRGDDSSLLIPVQVNGKWGIINNLGEYVVPIKYEGLFPLSKHFIGGRTSNGKLDILNKKGEIVLNGYNDDVCRIEEDIFFLKENDCWYTFDSIGNKNFLGKYDDLIPREEEYIWTKLNGKYGVINFAGKELIPCIYDEILDAQDYYSLFIKKKLIPVSREGKYSLYDMQGNVIAQNTVYSYQEATSNFVMTYNNGKYGVINKRGMEILTCQHDDIVIGGNVIGFKTGEKWNLVDSIGNQIADFIYDELYPVEDIIIGIKESSADIINGIGRINIPFKIYINYNTPFGFYGGISCPRDGIVKICSEKGIGLLDKNGQIIIPFKYVDITWEYNDENNDNHIVVLHDSLGQTGLANCQTGREIIPCKYEECATSRFQNSSHLAKVKASSGWGVVDTVGKVIVPFKYKDIKITEFCICANNGNNYVVYNLTGKEITTTTYYSDYKEFIQVKTDKGYGFICKSGKLIPGYYENIRELQDCIQVFVNNKCGLVSKKEEREIIPCDRYSFIFPTNKENYFICIDLREKWGIMNEEGNLVIPCQYDMIGLEFGLTRNNTFLLKSVDPI